MAPLSREVQARAKLAAAMERALIADIAAWLARVGKVAASAIRDGHLHAAEMAAFAVRHRLERTLAARMMAVAAAAARFSLDQRKAAGPMETKGLIADVIAAATRWVRAYSATRVTQIAETTRRTLRRLIDRAQGDINTPPQPPRELAKVIVLATSGDIGRRRAVRIARTETHVAAERGNFEATREMARTLGDSYVKRWNSVHDARTRPDHAAADGQEVDIDQPFRVGGAAMMFCGDPNGPPEQIINCFPADTVVSGLPLAVTRHWYEGLVAEITTAGGHKLTGTPNHPVLTDAGWKALGELEEGDNVICRGGTERVSRGDPDVNYVKSTLGELFDAGAVQSGVYRVAAVDVNFHGDRPTHDVDVAVLDWELRNGTKPALNQHLGQIGLQLPGPGFGMGEPDGAARKIIDATSPASHGFVSGLGQLGSLDGIGMLHSEPHGFGSIAGDDACILEAECDFPAISDAERRSDDLHGFARKEAPHHLVPDLGSSSVGNGQSGVGHCAASAGGLDDLPSGHGSDLKTLGDLFVGEAGLVSQDQVTSVRFRQFSGHVFNLEDVRGMYIASHIVVHNCRCVTTYLPAILAQAA